jgi:hypothetical protein
MTGRMSLAAKIVITIVVCLVLAAVAVVGLGALLWSRHGDDLVRAGRRQIAHGKAYGMNTDESGCLRAALGRYKGNPGLTGSIAAGVFVRACWQTSRQTAGFCDGVPTQLDLLRTVRWQAEQSRKAGVDEQFGGQIFAQLQAYCDAKARNPVSRR